MRRDLDQNTGVLDITVTAADEDVEDTLFLRLFVDYDPSDPQSPEREPNISPPGTVERTFLMTGVRVCPTPGEHVVEAIVSDRNFRDEEAPLRFRVTEGATAQVEWRVNCVEIAPPGDGGP